MNYYFTKSNIDLIAAVAARDIEQSIALGRQFGFRFPLEYKVGFRLREPLPGRAFITIRIDDVRNEVQASYNMQKGEDFFRVLRMGCIQVVHTWAIQKGFAPKDNRTNFFADRAIEIGSGDTKNFEDGVWEEATRQMKTSVYKVIR
jgi:hypothetical protein